MTRFSHLYPDWNNADDGGQFPALDDAARGDGDGGDPDEETDAGALRDLLDDLDDANEEVINRRLATYETESKPVLGYYGQDRITCIDATEPPAKVLLHILESVNGVNGLNEPAAV